MSVPLLDLQAQFAATREPVLAAVLDVIERQQFIMGPEVPRLEEAVAARCETRHAVACASGTDALLIPLRVLGLAPGDEVITPAFTFFATAGAIHNAGGTPVFADIEPATFNLDPEAIAAAITPRTRAIIVVHLYGQMAPMERILPLAARHGLAVIEDGAQSIGARRLIEGRWRPAGSLGTVGTLSFFPTKNLGGWGDGGMMLTGDDALAARLRAQRLHGGTREYYHDEVGLNSRLDTLQAAVLLAKLPFLDGWAAARRERAARYAAALGDLAGLTVPATDAANEHIWHQFTIRSARRDALAERLRARGIGHKVYYPLALHLQPCFRHLGYRPGSLPATEAATASVLSLPIFPELTGAQQDEVIEAIRDFHQSAS